MMMSKPVAAWASVVFVGFASALGASHVVAQEAGASIDTDTIQTRYEEAYSGGDAEALLSLFSEDAVHWAEGEEITGREALRTHFERHFEGMQSSETIDVRSEHTEVIGDRIFDIGSFTIEAAEAAGAAYEGKYVALVDASQDGGKMEYLLTFPAGEMQMQQ